jgi:hypothetical protein
VLPELDQQGAPIHPLQEARAESPVHPNDTFDRSSRNAVLKLGGSSHFRIR